MTILKLNEGLLLDSVYRPGGGLSGGVWDSYLLAPLLTPGFRADSVRRVAVIGGAAGTLGKLFTQFYGPIPVDQAEIDPKVIEIGQRFFGMTDENVTNHAMDGRNFLAGSSDRYDVIAIDAFRVPYVPFHLATKEFFEIVRDHLTDGGVLAANVVSAYHDSRLTDAFGSTSRRSSERLHATPAYFSGESGPELGNA
jgi:spermidine synthase